MTHLKREIVPYRAQSHNVECASHMLHTQSQANARHVPYTAAETFLPGFPEAFKLKMDSTNLSRIYSQASMFRPIQGLGRILLGRGRHPIQAALETLLGVRRPVAGLCLPAGQASQTTTTGAPEFSRPHDSTREPKRQRKCAHAHAQTCPELFYRNPQKSAVGPHMGRRDEEMPGRRQEVRTSEEPRAAATRRSSNESRAWSGPKM